MARISCRHSSDRGLPGNVPGSVGLVNVLLRRSGERNATRALVDKARASGLVTIVAAETLPEVNASGAVLRKLGFVQVSESSYADVGSTWRWELQLHD